MNCAFVWSKYVYARVHVPDHYGIVCPSCMHVLRVLVYKRSLVVAKSGVQSIMRESVQPRSSLDIPISYKSSALYSVQQEEVGYFLAVQYVPVGTSGTHSFHRVRSNFAERSGVPRLFY